MPKFKKNTSAFKMKSPLKGSSPAKILGALKRPTFEIASYYKGNSEFKQSNYNKKISELK